MASILMKTLQLVPRAVCRRPNGLLEESIRGLSVSGVARKAELPVKSEPAPAVPGLITVEGVEDLSPINGHPPEEIRTRRVRIYQPAKNAMQSGTHNIHRWQLDFDTQERWENPLMGWASTGDPLSNVQLSFATQEEAVEFCQKNGWDWSVDIKTPVKPKVKSYGANFSWNKNTRTSTK